MTPVTRHVVIACSASKLAEPAAASRLYTGVVWQAWRKGMRGGGLPNGWALWALSAKYGLVPSFWRLDPYDVTLKGANVLALAGRVQRRWESRPAWLGGPGANQLDLSEVVVIGGELYQLVARMAGLPVVRVIDGRPDGIGLLRQRVRYWADQIHRGMDIFPGTADAFWPGKDPERSQESLGDDNEVAA